MFMFQLIKWTKDFRDHVGHDRVLTLGLAEIETERNVVGCWEYLLVEDDTVRAVCQKGGLLQAYDIIYDNLHHLFHKLL